MAENKSHDILHDFTPMLRHYKDGRIERFMGVDVVPPSLDPTTGVQSKDVQFSSEPPLSARLYLPKTAGAKKLPVLIYFHGGGFVIESAFSPVYQNHLNRLVSESNVVAVSVNYRLAPENPLPAAFEDAWRALEWAASDAADEWIKNHGDLENVYLGGDSAGGNIAHYTAVRYGGEAVPGLKLRGMFLNCPFFWGKDPIPDSGETKNEISKKFVDKLWEYAWPGMESLDAAWINPAADEKVGTMGCGRVLVHVAEKDLLKERGWYYKEALEKSGWNGEIRVVDVEGEEHVFSVLKPDAEKSVAMVKEVADFINYNH